MKLALKAGRERRQCIGRVMEKLRKCGQCGERDIPFGVDWPWWLNGMPVHQECFAQRCNHRRAYGTSDTRTGDPICWCPDCEMEI